MSKISENKKIKYVLDELKEKLNELFTNELLKIIVFGSYVNGTSDFESDLDIFVIINRDDIESCDDVLLDLAVDLSLKYDIVISAFLESYSNFNKYKTIKPLYSEILKNGVDIYAA